MKRILSSMFAVTALAMSVISCSKDGDAPHSERRGNLISFGLDNIVATRAYVEATGATVQSNGFKVAAVTNDNALFFNEDATYSSSSASYSTSTKYYYPSGKTLSFYACYPKSQTISVTSGAASTAYTHNSDTDLLVAAKTGVSSSSSKVSLAFNHALTRVKVTATGDDALVTYKVKSVTVKGFSSGVYTYSNSKMTGISAMSGAQSVYSGTVVLESDKQDLGFDGTFIPGDVTVACTWECYAGSVLVGSYTADGVVTLTQGHQNTINLLLKNSSAKPIEFTVTVNPWADNEDKDLVLE